MEKIRQGRLDEVRPCLGCHEGCLGRIANGPVSCAVNPACGREMIYGIIPALKKKRVLVAGGGIAGMETARVAAISGHDVTLCEKSGQLGGNLIPGGVPHFKRGDHKLVAWYRRQLELLVVDVRMNTAVTPEFVNAFAPDVVVTATGSLARTLSFAGAAQPISAEAALLGKAPVGDHVVIVGGGLVGCETGLWLAQQGKQVAVVEILPELLGGHGKLPHMNEFMLMDLLKFHKVQTYTGASVTDTSASSVTVTQDGKTMELPADTLIVAAGYASDNGLYESLKDLDIPVYNIGDSNQVHNIMYAIWNAYELARNL